MLPYLPNNSNIPFHVTYIFASQVFSVHSAPRIFGERSGPKTLGLRRCVTDHHPFHVTLHGIFHYDVIHHQAIMLTNVHSRVLKNHAYVFIIFIYW